MFKKLFDWISIFETNLSAAEWAWRLLTFALVAGGGTTAAWLAKGTKLFAAVGHLGLFAVGLLCSALIVLILFFIKLGNKQSAEAEYLRSLTQRKCRINPLADSFTDQIIYLPDLYLPRMQLHSNKQFKRCKLVGPGAVALMGGNFIHTHFQEAGSVIAIPPNTILTGILVLANCTVEDCEFIGITLLIDKQSAQVFEQLGATIVGA